MHWENLIQFKIDCQLIKSILYEEINIKASKIGKTKITKIKRKKKNEGLQLVEILVSVHFTFIHFPLFVPQSGHDSSLGIELQSSRTKSNAIPPGPQRSNHTFNCKSIESSYNISREKKNKN